MISSRKLAFSYFWSFDKREWQFWWFCVFIFERFSSFSSRDLRKYLDLHALKNWIISNDKKLHLTEHQNQWFQLSMKSDTRLLHDDWRIQKTNVWLQSDLDEQLLTRIKCQFRCSSTFHHLFSYLRITIITFVEWIAWIRHFHETIKIM
jgi:hypothetical protein